MSVCSFSLSYSGCFLSLTTGRIFGEHFTREGIGCLVGTIGGVILFFLIIPAFLVFAIWLVAFIEGVIYLSMTQEQFDKTYMLERRAWF